MQELLEYCGDLLVSRGSYHSGIILYKQAKVHLLKRVLKLAVSADCKTLLKFVHLCLNASKVDMSAATKIHIGNLAVMAYTELILRYGGSQRVANTKEFMNFVNSLDCYDQTLAVNVACQAGIWNVLNILAKCRGLEPEVACAMRQILQSARAPKPTDTQFLLALSEPCLTQTLLLLDESAPVIFKYIRTNVEMFPIEILQRFACQLDPSQPCAVPVISRLFSNKKFSSSLDTTIESVDLENPDKTIVTAKDFIDTFLTVVINLISKTENNSFDLHLLENIDPPELPSYGVSIKKFPDLHPLSCGYEHAAVVRNNSVYTMGAEVSGTSSSPKLVETLSLLKLKVLSVSCGKKHTLALTEFGMYAWGSNTYGQLGISYYLQDTSYPQILTSISSLKIVDIAAGQYHSIALTSSGKVYTWGWGIHGQLGHGDCDNEYYPKLLDFPHPVKQVAGGHAHSLILTCEGKLYGFGSNAFGQVNNTQVDMNKHTRPVWVLIMPDMQTPIEKISSSYFHNIAVTADQEVYIWGASPQELRFHSKQNNQKQSGTPQNSSNSWKSCVRVYSATKKPVDQVALGFRHFALIHDGKMFWGKIKEDDLSHPKMREEDIMNGFFPQKFLHVSCGLDYTMAMDHTGKLLAWGSESMEKILLGKPMAYNEHYQHLDCRFALFRNSRRVIKLPFVVHGTYDVYPIEVPGLPTMAITFTPADQRLLFSRNYVPYAIRKIENDDVSLEELYSKNSSFTDYLNQPFNFKIGNKTLHYALEKYFGHYDTDSILSRCLEVHNYQAAAKIAMLEGHFSDSLGFQLMAFKEHMKTLNVNLNSVCVKKNAPELNEKEQGYVELIVRNIQEDLNEKKSDALEFCSPAHILSPIYNSGGDDVEHQGGCESPCEMSDSGDIRQNISQYVQSLKNNENSPPISSVSKMVSEIDNVQTKIKNMDSGIQISDKSAKEIIDAASYLVEFYIKKIYVSENHILMQNILLKCIEFWLTNSLPVPILENILLKNMDKYFYPLSILLFCKNFDNNLDDEIMKDDSDVKPTSGFLKQFSTKFCLQLCSMVLENGLLLKKVGRKFLAPQNYKGKIE
ncbi:hypothetical protein NQ317_016590 [Molorchus minor]|uniref:RCC1-like domain-containing protein n=1 Tax=Molorchus minor TaxID=1323400 RepID=A0ABQ9IZN0_9CUCU|nr:hypothetical protein NQ317_016590 [Molorchus minor]